MTDAASAGSSTSTAGEEGGKGKGDLYRASSSSSSKDFKRWCSKDAPEEFFLPLHGLSLYPPFRYTPSRAPRSFSAGAWRRGEKGGEKGPERGLAGRSAHKHLGGKRALPDAKGSGINTSRVYFSSGSKLTRGKSEEASRRVSGLITGSVCKPERKKARAPIGGGGPFCSSL